MHDGGGPLPTVVRDTVRAYLEAVDAAAPGLVGGFYLTGSVALGDFRPHTSDIDFVAVVEAPLSASTTASLAGVHARLRAQPFLDGIYVTWRDLAGAPSAARPGPHTNEGRFHAESTAQRHPVSWYTLARHGIALRGPARAEIEIWTDAAVLAAWTRANLEAYWRPWRERGARLLSRAGMAMLGEWAPAWGVLGVSRLHYTLATGEITSKEGAGLYARDALPSRWHRVLDECLRIRRGEGGRSLYRNPPARRREALLYMEAVLADAHYLP